MTTATLSTTTPEAKNAILADLWIQERDNTDFTEFIEYNDLGLPMAYMVQNGLITPSETGQMFIDECFSLLLAALDLEDQGFTSLAQLLDTEENNVIPLQFNK